MKSILATVLLSVAAHAQAQNPAFNCEANAVLEVSVMHDYSKGINLSREEEAEVAEHRLRCRKPDAATSAREQRFEILGQRYMNCAAVAVAVLDDGVSDASSIAQAVRSQCVEHLQKLAAEPVSRDSKTWGELLQPGVINKVLARRAAVRAQRMRTPPQHPNIKQM